MQGSLAAMLIALVVTIAGCAPTSTSPAAIAGSPTVGPTGGSGGSSAPALTATASPMSVGPGPTPSGPTLASGATLPPCVPRAPKASATVTFVASGDAWAMSPRGADLACLFAVADPGRFAWGPLGDRVLLAGVEVRGVAGGPSLPANDAPIATIAWSRPTGKSIIFSPGDGMRLEKAPLDGGAIEDVTPLPASTYLSVTYHPSGEAFAFAVARADGQSIWISTNRGGKPTQLVFSTEGTTFGAMAFDPDGTHLVYAAQHADDHAELHIIDITDPSRAPVAWEGPVGRTIVDLVPGPKTGSVAWTTATTSCADRVAMVRTAEASAAIIPGAAGPTRVLGWLNGTTLLVGIGGCDGPIALSAVDVSTGADVPLISGVATAAARAPVATPPAPLPRNVVIGGSGFS